MTHKFDARIGVSRRALSTSVFAAVLAAGAAAAPSGPARAQVVQPQAYFQPYVQTHDWQAPARPRGESYVSRRDIAAILYGEGYRLAGPIDYRDDAIIVVGADDQGRRMRFFLDPDDGEVVGARRLEPPRPSPSGAYDQDARVEPPSARPLDSRPREIVSQPPVAAPRKERSSEAAAPAGMAHQSAALGDPGAAARPERPRPPAVASIQRSSPRPTALVTQDPAHGAAAPQTSQASPAPPRGLARPDGPPAPSASNVQKASPRPATPPIAHGSAHRAIVPPPGAAQTSPAAPVVGSTGTPAPAPGAAKPGGG
jgi:hypothetical protein